MSTEPSESDPTPEVVSASAESETITAPTGASRVGPKPRRVVALLFGVAATVLALDVLSKILAVATLEGQPPVKLFGGAVYLELFRNPGAAFSLATGMTWLLALLAMAIVGVIIWWAPKLRSRGWAVGLGLVLGGACGNLVDRLFRAPGPLQGHVVDFISLLAPHGNFFAVFNLADSGICTGGALVVLLSVLGREYDGSVSGRPRKSTKQDANVASEEPSGAEGEERR